VSSQPLNKSMFTRNNIQWQIECNSSNTSQTCFICKNQFQMSEARLIACNDRGDSYGDVCPHCLTKGGAWINDRLQLSIMSQPIV
jgi:hypothetical protein